MPRFLKCHFSHGAGFSKSMSPRSAAKPEVKLFKRKMLLQPCKAGPTHLLPPLVIFQKGTESLPHFSHPFPLHQQSRHFVLDDFFGSAAPLSHARFVVSHGFKVDEAKPVPRTWHGKNGAPFIEGMQRLFADPARKDDVPADPRCHGFVLEPFAVIAFTDNDQLSVRDPVSDGRHGFDEPIMTLGASARLTGGRQSAKHAGRSRGHVLAQDGDSSLQIPPPRRGRLGGR